MSSRESRGYRPPHQGPRPWPGADYDAALHLLDRQVVDVDGRLVGKVDDIELTEQDGALVPTGLLVGLGALLPRCGTVVGPWLARRYEQISVSHATRRAPSVVDLDMVADVTSAVHLTAPRAGLLRPRVPGPHDPPRRRLGELMAMRVHAAPATGLPQRSRLLDVRLESTGTTPDRSGHLVVASLLVGPGRPGLLLGYDRRRVTGPWPVAVVVRRLHRHARLVEWGRGVEVDWEHGEIRIGEVSVRRLDEA